MIRLGKLTDYGLLLMAEIARTPGKLHTARDLSANAKLPLPTVSKVLKTLLQSKLLVSHRGTRGGYSLVREPQAISITEIITALEGPLALTECSMTVSVCDLEPSCPMKDNQRIINQVIHGALAKVMLSDLIRPLQVTAMRDEKSGLVTITGLTPGSMQ